MQPSYVTPVPSRLLPYLNSVKLSADEHRPQEGKKKKKKK